MVSTPRPPSRRRSRSPARRRAAWRRKATRSRPYSRPCWQSPSPFYLGEKINDWARGNGLVLPGFLSAMLVAVALANGADACGLKLRLKPIEIGGEVSLNLFLAISLMGTPLAAVASMALPLAINVVAQLVVIVVI